MDYSAKGSSTEDHNYLYRTFALLIGLFISGIAGCGSDDNQDVGKSASTEVVVVDTFTVDSKASAQLRAAVVQIITAVSTGQVGGKVAIQPPQSGESSLIVGANQAGDALLLSLDPETKVLSVESTAEAIVRIALGKTIESVSSKQLGTLIREADGFGELVSALRTDLDIGTPIRLTANLTDLAWRPATAVIERLGKKTAVEVRSTALDLSSGKDFLIRSKEATDNLWVSDLINSNSVVLSNQTRLAWQASSKPGTSLRIEALNVHPWLALIAYYGGSQQDTILQGSAEKFIVTVEQTKNTQAYNSLNLTQKFIFAALDVALSISPDKVPAGLACSKVIADYLTGNELSNLIQGMNGPAALQYLASVIQPKKILDALSTPDQSCTQIIAPTAGVEKFLGAVLPFVKIVLLVPSSVAVGQGAYQLATHWDDRFERDVCKSGGVVVPCEDGFYSGTAEITDCTVPVGVKGGCNFLSYNINLGNSAELAFRVGQEPLNIRLDQQYGCIGTASTITATPGAQFSYELNSDSPFPKQVPSTTTYFIDKADNEEISGSLRVVFDLRAYNLREGIGSAVGKWRVNRRAKPFPKCNLPTIPSGRDSTGNPRGGDTPKFFCSNFGDYWGCNFLPVNADARPTDWMLSNSPPAR